MSSDSAAVAGRAYAMKTALVGAASAALATKSVMLFGRGDSGSTAVATAMLAGACWLATDAAWFASASELMLRAPGAQGDRGDRGAWGLLVIHDLSRNLESTPNDDVKALEDMWNLFDAAERSASDALTPAYSRGSTTAVVTLILVGVSAALMASKRRKGKTDHRRMSRRETDRVTTDWDTMVLPPPPRFLSLGGGGRPATRTHHYKKATRQAVRVVGGGGPPPAPKAAAQGNVIVPANTNMPPAAQDAKTDIMPPAQGNVIVPTDATTKMPAAAQGANTNVPAATVTQDANTNVPAATVAQGATTNGPAAQGNVIVPTDDTTKMPAAPINVIYAAANVPAALNVIVPTDAMPPAAKKDPGGDVASSTPGKEDEDSPMASIIVPNGPDEDDCSKMTRDCCHTTVSNMHVKNIENLNVGKIDIGGSSLNDFADLIASNILGKLNKECGDAPPPPPLTEIVVPQGRGTDADAEVPLKEVVVPLSSPVAAASDGSQTPPPASHVIVPVTPQAHTNTDTGTHASTDASTSLHSTNVVIPVGPLDPTTHLLSVTDSGGSQTPPPASDVIVPVTPQAHTSTDTGTHAGTSQPHATNVVIPLGPSTLDTTKTSPFPTTEVVVPTSVPQPTTTEVVVPSVPGRDEPLPSPPAQGIVVPLHNTQPQPPCPPPVAVCPPGTINIEINLNNNTTNNPCPCPCPTDTPPIVPPEIREVLVPTSSSKDSLDVVVPGSSDHGPNGPDPIDIVVPSREEGKKDKATNTDDDPKGPEPDGKKRVKDELDPIDIVVPGKDTRDDVGTNTDNPNGPNPIDVVVPRIEDEDEKKGKDTRDIGTNTDNPNGPDPIDIVVPGKDTGDDVGTNTDNPNGPDPIDIVVPRMKGKETKDVGTNPDHDPDGPDPVDIVIPMGKDNDSHGDPPVPELGVVVPGPVESDEVVPVPVPELGVVVPGPVESDEVVPVPELEIVVPGLDLPELEVVVPGLDPVPVDLDIVIPGFGEKEDDVPIPSTTEIVIPFVKLPPPPRRRDDPPPLIPHVTLAPSRYKIVKEEWAPAEPPPVYTPWDVFAHVSKGPVWLPMAVALSVSALIYARWGGIFATREPYAAEIPLEMFAASPDEQSRNGSEGRPAFTKDALRRSIDDFLTRDADVKVMASVVTLVASSLF